MKVSVPGNHLVVAGIFVLFLSVFFTSSALAGCRSYAEKIEDAEEFCEMKLKCKAPEVVVCHGNTREWKCECAIPKEDAAKTSEEKLKSGYSVKEDADMPPSKPVKEK
jgi:hypothetical protein